MADVLVVADDLTGANAAAAGFARSGLRAVTASAADRADVVAEMVSRFDVVVATTDSRHAPAEVARERVTAVVQAGWPSRLVCNRIDTTLRGKTIKAGDKVVIWYVSADYDEDVFDRPYELDLGRTPNPQVAFGLMSPHLCLGAQLARMEIKLLFQELLPRITSAELAGPVERMRSNFIAGIKSLPVRLTTS